MSENRSNKTSELLKSTARYIGIGFLFLPLQIFLFILGVGLTRHLYSIVHYEVFGLQFPWGVRIDIRRFYEFWFTGIGIHVIHTVIYIPFALVPKFKISTTKNKVRLHMLGALAATSVFSAVVFDIRSPRTSGLPGLNDLGYSITYAFLFTTIMFATFTISATLFDKYTKLKEWIKALLSFLISCVLGGFLSYIVWIGLFMFFHG